MSAPGSVAHLRDLAKNVVGDRPIVMGNPIVHRIQRFRAYRDAEVQPELTGRRDLLDPLLRNGIVVRENYLRSDQVRAMREGSIKVIRKVEDGEFEDMKYTVQPDILFRVGPIDQMLPETLPFFDDGDIRSVVDAAMSPKAVPCRRELEYRFGVGKNAQADLYHFDNWRPILKAFLYLDDVGPDQAPFVYLAGSHKSGSWRRRHEREFDGYGPTGPFGHFFPQEMRALRENHDWEEIVCTGKAGTLILADFRGLHRGTPLRSGHRILLNQTFDLMNA